MNEWLSHSKEAIKNTIDQDIQWIFIQCLSFQMFELINADPLNK